MGTIINLAIVLAALHLFLRVFVWTFRLAAEYRLYDLRDRIFALGIEHEVLRETLLFRDIDCLAAVCIHVVRDLTPAGARDFVDAWTREEGNWCPPSRADIYKREIQPFLGDEATVSAVESLLDCPAQAKSVMLFVRWASPISGALSRRSRCRQA